MKDREEENLFSSPGDSATHDFLLTLSDEDSSEPPTETEKDVESYEEDPNALFRHAVAYFDTRANAEGIELSPSALRNADTDTGQVTNHS